MPDRIVQQGEHLSSIAAEAGFTTIAPVWTHPSNADLRALRVNPHVLYPGDSIFVPDLDVPISTGQTARRHRFQLLADPTLLRLTLLGIDGKPLAGVACTLDVDADHRDLAADADGKLDVTIPSTARVARLSVAPADGQTEPWTVELQVGDLDPIDTPSGQAGRLRNLGYPADPQEDESPDDALAFAVQCFQQDNALAIDGICGPDTQSKLKTLHGS